VSSPPRSEPDWAALRAAVAGQVVLPGSPGYERLRRPAIALFHGTRPRAVVTCRTPAGVAETLALARRHGLPVAPRSGGHCFAGRSSADGIVVDVSPMTSVEIAGAVVTVGAGARLGDLYAALDAEGVTVPARGADPGSGSPGSPWAAGSASWAAPTASRPTTWPSERGWCWPTAGWSTATPGATPACSGPCAARAAASSVWSPR